MALKIALTVTGLYLLLGASALLALFETVTAVEVENDR